MVFSDTFMLTTWFCIHCSWLYENVPPKSSGNSDKSMYLLNRDRCIVIHCYYSNARTWGEENKKKKNESKDFFQRTDNSRLSCVKIGLMCHENNNRSLIEKIMPIFNIRTEILIIGFVLSVLSTKKYDSDPQQPNFASLLF